MTNEQALAVREVARTHDDFFAQREFLDEMGRPDLVGALALAAKTHSKTGLYEVQQGLSSQPIDDCKDAYEHGESIAARAICPALTGYGLSAAGTRSLLDLNDTTPSGLPGTPEREAFLLALDVVLAALVEPLTVEQAVAHDFLAGLPALGLNTLEFDDATCDDEFDDEFDDDDDDDDDDEDDGPENLIDVIGELISADVDAPDKQAELLQTRYETASPEGRALLDEAFTALCGYGLGTLIRDR